MSFLRSGFYAALGTGARLIAALVVVKLVASSAGPEGIGRLGQFMSLMSVLAVFAGGGISSGVVKCVAEYREDASRLSRLLAAALWYALIASCVMGAATWLFSRPIAAWLMGDAGYASLVRVLAVAQLGIAVVNYMLAVVNGFMDVRRLAVIQVAGSILAMLAALWLSRWLHLYGALLALVLGQSLWLLVAFPACWKSPYFRRGMLRMRFDREMTGRLAAFSTMTLTSALVPPLVNIAVRDHLAARFGWEQVGYWQAVSRVSDAYLLFLVTAITVHYLPRLASTKGKAALVAEFRQAYRFLLPVVVAIAAVVYLMREPITRVLFSADFTAGANDLYGPQLVGDVFKIASFVLAYLMLAKSMTRLFIVSEIVFGVTYFLLVCAFTTTFGVIGAMYAFAANYALYLVFNVVVVRRYLGGL